MDAMRIWKAWSSDRGAELIEFALTFPILLLVVMGIIDFGLLFQQYEVLTNAAREGARVSVLPGYATDAGGNPTDVNVRARVDQYLQGTGLTAASVTMVPLAPQVVTIGPGLCATVWPVTLSYVHQYTFLGGIAGYFGGSFGTKTLTASASMRSETPASVCP